MRETHRIGSASVAKDTCDPLELECGGRGRGGGEGGGEGDWEGGKESKKKEEGGDVESGDSHEPKKGWESSGRPRRNL